MSLAAFHDTIAAISTPLGRSALAIVRISGDDAIGIVASVVSDAPSLLTARAGASIHCNVVSDDGVVDDVVVHIHRAPRSYTGEDLLEITTHGSPVIARQVLSLLSSRGARQAEPGEFSRRAFFNGKIGLEEAELIAVKADAESEAVLRGSELALHEKFARLRAAHDELITLVAWIDAEIDFGESDNVVIQDFDQRKATVIDSLAQLVRESANRREGAGYFTVALTGPPNVGKSSLFNALLAHERSIVSDQPGTTRDFVESFIEIDGFRVKLVDTAGIRESSESIEARGIELGVNAAEHADLILRLTDPSDRLPLIESNVTVLHNKIDLDSWETGLRVSAQTGTGLRELHSWLASELHSHSSELALVSLSEGERAKLISVMSMLQTVDQRLEPAILAEELRTAASGLAEFLGINVSEESLAHIFAKMCIGK